MSIKQKQASKQLHTSKIETQKVEKRGFVCMLFGVLFVALVWGRDESVSSLLFSRSVWSRSWQRLAVSCVSSWLFGELAVQLEWLRLVLLVAA
jgi:hypothetical protein